MPINRLSDSMMSEDDFQLQLNKSMFGTPGSDEDNSDDESGISEHIWTCHNTSIIYHLAFLAPGHGDSLWNSSECIAEHLLQNHLRTNELFGEKVAPLIPWPPETSLEFGAGAALPGLALLKQGAKKVIFTDRFVNQQTFDALKMSVEKNCQVWGIADEEIAKRAVVTSHTWGEDVEKLITMEENLNGEEEIQKICVLIASDCIYNPNYHDALLQSASQSIDKNVGIFIVGYSFHMNVTPDQVVAFFEMANSKFGLTVVSEFTKVYDGQRGIGGTDRNRGAVHVKVLASERSIFCR